VIGERRVVRAFMEAQPISVGDLEVELREVPETTDPRSGLPIPVPPLVIVWVRERPLAVRIRYVVAVNRSGPSAPLAGHIEAEAISAGLPVERVCEAGLWRLFSRPPRPRLARPST
jgi:hypothetical protein